MKHSMRTRFSATAMAVCSIVAAGTATLALPGVAEARSGVPGTSHGRPRPARPARPAKPAAPKARSQAANRAVWFALAQQGKRYTQEPGHRTGDFNDGFDCSGLVWRAYIQSGVWLGGSLRYTQSMITDPQLIEIPWYQVLPGDLIFMTMPGGRSNGHVVMALGDGKIVEASSVAGMVRVNTLADKVAHGATGLRFFAVKAK